MHIEAGGTLGMRNRDITKSTVTTEMRARLVRVTSLVLTLTAGSLLAGCGSDAEPGSPDTTDNGGPSLDGGAHPGPTLGDASAPGVDGSALPDGGKGPS